MKIEITLGIIKSGNETVQVPFWFTRDNSIMLNPTTPKVVVEIDETAQENLIQIRNCVSRGDIKVSDIKALDSKLATLLGYDVETKEPEPKKVSASMEEISDIKNGELVEKAKELQSLSVTKLRKQVGNSELTKEGDLQRGISDAELLKSVLEVENGSAIPRSSVINMVEKRIASIKEVGFTISESESLEVTEEDDRNIVFNEAEGTLNEIEKEEDDKE